MQLILFIIIYYRCVYTVCKKKGENGGGEQGKSYSSRDWKTNVGVEECGHVSRYWDSFESLSCDSSFKASTFINTVDKESSFIHLAHCIAFFQLTLTKRLESIYTHTVCSQIHTAQAMFMRHEHFKEALQLQIRWMNHLSQVLCIFCSYIIHYFT